MPKIILENVTKRFEKFVAVDNLSMVIEDREFITLLGPSGCGKTTTLRMIAGLEIPTEGRITIGNTVVFDSEAGINISPSKRDIGFLFQNYALWPHMTVYQNIAFGLENLKWPKEQIRSRVNEMLSMLKIEQFEARYPSELSGGQQQRVAIARTLAPRPKVLFMDEPLSNLDAKLRLEMRAELKRLHADTDSTFVYVTHDQLEAMTLATRVCLMKVGVLQQYAPPLTVYNYPENLFVADFVGSPTMNFINAEVTGVENGVLSLSAGDLRFKYATENAVEVAIGKKVTLGFRPEFIRIEENGPLMGTVYSTLPSGMETIVQVQLGQLIITLVIFGGVDYKIHEPVSMNITTDNVILFDTKTTCKLATGAIQFDNRKDFLTTNEQEVALNATGNA